MYSVKLPGSKSVLIRLLILASQQNSEIFLQGYTGSRDVLTVQTALERLGCRFVPLSGGMKIIPYGDYRRQAEIKIIDSATGFRLLLALLCTIEGGRYSLDASFQLRKRPFLPLVKALREMSAEIEDDSFPYIITGKSLTGEKASIDTTISSQYLSALLLAAPRLEQGICLNIRGSRVSWSYVEMTIKLLREFGIKVQRDESRIFIEPGNRLSAPDNYLVESDYSSACYFWALAAISGKAVFVPGRRKCSSQPDAGFADILAEMGAQLLDDDSGTIIIGKRLHGIKIDMKQMPDQIPTLSVLGLLAESPLEIYNIQRLKYKESDRVQSIRQEISRLGGRAEIENGILRIFPLKKPPAAVTCSTHSDHRIAMAFSLLLLRYPWLKFDDEDVVKKSFPDFWQEFKNFSEAD
jgi:3-phosphoshikimate 1-carboxyvinyltransferase